MNKQQIINFKEDCNIYKIIRKTSRTKYELYKRICIRSWNTEEFSNLKECIIKYYNKNKPKKTIYSVSYWFGKIFEIRDKLKR